MYQAQSSIPTALQALMVLRQQANPTAPGPGGQLIPTVAAQTAQQMMPPPMQAVAQNAATGANIQAMQQQNAQKALMDQMLAQQQAKAQQPVLAAEGGIASLDVDGMDDYAEGGVVGFAEGGIPVGQATTLSPEAAEWLQQREKIKAAEEALKRKEAAQLAQKIAAGRPELLRPLMQSLYESAKSGPAMVIGGVGSLLSKFAAGQMEANPELRAAYENPMLGAMDPEGAMAAAILSQPTREEPQRNEPAAPTPATFKFAENTPPGAIINALTGQLRSDTSLSEADRTAIAKEIQNQFVRLGSQPQEAASAGLPVALPSAQAPQQAAIRRPSLAETVTEVGRAFPAPDDRTMREEMRGLQALQAQRATPDEAIAQLEATRARQREIYERQLASQGSLGELMSVLGSISRRGDGLTGLQEYRSDRDKAELAQIALDQNLSNEKRLLREKYLADQIGDKSSSLKFEEALYKNAEERQKLLAQTSASAFSAQAGMFNAQTAADQRAEVARLVAESKGTANTEKQDVAELKALIASLKDQADPMKNFDKASREQASELLRQAQEKLARMSGIGGGGQVAPAVGTVMQGYRFKGGNPADQNNWEKV